MFWPRKYMGTSNPSFGFYFLMFAGKESVAAKKKP